MSPLARVHAAYVAAILGAVIVLQASVNWSSLGDVGTLFGFAATLTSLVLGIIAIVYSIVANAAQSDTHTRIVNAACGMESASKDVQGQSAEIKSATLDFTNAVRTTMKDIPVIIPRIDQFESTVQAAVLGLTEASDRVNKAAVSLESRLIDIDPAIKGMSAKIDRLAVGVAPQGTAGQPDPLSSDDRRDRLTRIARGGSVWGRLALYAACLAQKRNVPLVPAALPTSMADGFDMYAIGYLMALSATGVISAAATIEANQVVINVSSPPDIDVAALKRSIQASSAEPKNAAVKENWTKTLAAIERTFGPANQ